MYCILQPHAPLEVWDAEASEDPPRPQPGRDTIL